MKDGTPSLRILALLPSPLQVRLMEAVERLPMTIVCLLPGPHSLPLVRDSVSLVIVDPMGDGAARWTSVLLCRKPVMPLIVYTAMTSASARVITALRHEGLRELVLTPYEDSPLRLARTLWRVATSQC